MPVHLCFGKVHRADETVSGKLLSSKRRGRISGFEFRSSGPPIWHLQVVERLPHVAVCCENDRLQSTRHMRHLEHASPTQRLNSTTGVAEDQSRSYLQDYCTTVCGHPAGFSGWHVSTKLHGRILGISPNGLCRASLAGEPCSRKNLVDKAASLEEIVDQITKNAVLPSRPGRRTGCAPAARRRRGA